LWLLSEEDEIRMRKKTKIQRLNAKQKRYLEHRKKGLKQLMKLIYDRDEIQKEIRELRRDLKLWDNVLIQED
jgi:hypothetical protein